MAGRQCEFFLLHVLQCWVSKPVVTEVAEILCLLLLNLTICYVYGWFDCVVKSLLKFRLQEVRGLQSRLSHHLSHHEEKSSLTRFRGIHLVMNVRERQRLSSDILKARKGFCSEQVSRSKAGPPVWVDGLLSDLCVKCDLFTADIMPVTILFSLEFSALRVFFYSHFRVPDLEPKTLGDAILFLS